MCIAARMISSTSADFGQIPDEFVSVAAGAVRTRSASARRDVLHDATFHVRGGQVSLPSRPADHHGRGSEWLRRSTTPRLRVASGIWWLRRDRSAAHRRGGPGHALMGWWADLSEFSPVLAGREARR